MNAYKQALKEIQRTGNRLDDTAMMVELVCAGLVTYKDHYGPPVLTDKGRAMVVVNDDYDYYYHKPSGDIVRVTVHACRGEEWTVNDGERVWVCTTKNIYMKPTKGQ